MSGHLIVWFSRVILNSNPMHPMERPETRKLAGVEVVL